MPTYVYQEILPDGSDGEAFEYIQRMSDAALQVHPKTGNPVRKVFSAPNVSTKYTEGSTKNKLSDENIEKNGFTRYERDKVTGRYNKTAGKDKRAPDVVDATKLKEIQQNGLVG
jgi:predicted nucleic acid-binding Zn ribbon protein